MAFEESHLSDEEILLTLDGELPPGTIARNQAHLDRCPFCRARTDKLEETLGQFVRLRGENLNARLPPPNAQRALLRARIEEIANAREPWWRHWPYAFGWRHAAAALLFAAVIVAGYFEPRSRAGRHNVPVSIPEPSLTPGAIATSDRNQVCQSTQPKNRIVPVSMQRRVFEEYGIAGAEPQAYEVDYLITPALGGADDIRNLWPQSNSSAVWNARVKDALEDRLRELVCEGSLDLASAQHDISLDWIAAYRKYFHTDEPVPGAR